MRYLLIILCIFISSLSHALSLKPNAPKRYVVQHGDSLWSIANRYLLHPWEWRELLRANPKIKNPNKIYAGMTLVLCYDHGNPYVKVLPNGTVKLSPSPRLREIKERIPAIPLGDIKPFLSESLILDENVLPRAPYVVGILGERMLGGQGDEAYVKGLHPCKDLPQGSTFAYSIFRSGKPYTKENCKIVLGYRAKLVGYAELEKGGEPATVLLTSITEGIRPSDRVLTNNAPEFELYFEPQAPSQQVHGQIIDMPTDMPNGNTQGAVGNIVVLDLGATSGIKAGDILGIYSKPTNAINHKYLVNPIRLPPERIGEVMVFRAFTKASFALIVRSSRAVYLSDAVTNP